MVSHSIRILCLDYWELEGNIFARQLPVNCRETLQLVLRVVPLLRVQENLNSEEPRVKNCNGSIINEQYISKEGFAFSVEIRSNTKFVLIRTWTRLSSTLLAILCMVITFETSAIIIKDSPTLIFMQHTVFN